jgi:polyribonucleotide nucleotidyltransferase
MKKKTLKIHLGNETELIFETGKIAKQSNGSVFLHCGDTTILSTACASLKASEEIDFFPLRVDYQEKFSSVGKTLGGFIKREGRLTAHEILTSRLIDRTIRPLFPDGYFNEVQILTYVYSYNGKHMPDVLGMCAVSAALAISDIPFSKPIGAVRVGMINNEFIINPTPEQKKESTLDLVMGGSEDAILMVEGFCDFLTEDQVIEAIEFGHNVIKKICSNIAKWAEEIGKEKELSTVIKTPQEITDKILQLSKESLEGALTIVNKKQREQVLRDIFTNIENTLCNKEAPLYSLRDVKTAFKKVTSNIMRKMILEENKRIDGRKLDEIRSIDAEIGILSRTHGSALFTRGETQALAVCTLGGENMAQRYENIHEEGTQKFYLQYFFPPFSVGEVGRNGPPGRREIGHGKLAERALAAVLPSEEEFPYIIRLESNITESNGSSSMASVCGGCLALMDSGVPIKKPVSGIAMGLVLEKDNYKILSDIIGAEDALGDMDFKITGDHEGITAFQMDIKVEGITKEIMHAALKQARDGRKFILDKMLAICPSTKNELSMYAPRIVTLKIKPSQIGTVIGPGGKQIRSIIEETGVDIDINDDGIVRILANDPASLEQARAQIIDLTADVEIDKVYNGKIVSIVPFGLFVAIYSKEGLCHISEVSHQRIEDLRDFYKEGDSIEVKVIDINDRGQIKLSHKALIKKEDEKK